MRKVILSILAAAGIAAAAGAAQASEAVHLDKQTWSWQGIFGTYDRGALQRGFQVYRDVCGNCHSLNLLAYRHLAGIGLTEEQIKEVAATKEVQDGPNDQGEMFMRPARPSDKFVPPFPNEATARMVNGGALPPDLSLMAKARIGGPDYVYNLMLGYLDTPPEGVELMPGMFYNKVFPGHQIAMPPQLQDDLVTYADNTKATKEQIAKDIVTFLNWAAEPELEERKQLGVKVMIFLLVLTAMMYALKRKIWSDLH